jgi:bifunctional non-homologous end joining protein LigD
MGLAAYRHKRVFSNTPEPKGAVKKTKDPQHIFVVHRHAASHLHYDLRLEMDGVLKSWAVPKMISMNPKVKRLAIQVEDHPYEYHTFEGTIPKGEYGAGKVSIWDHGTYEKRSGSIRSGELVVALSGKRLHGEFALIRMNAKDEEPSHDWLIIKKKE